MQLPAVLGRAGLFPPSAHRCRRGSLSGRRRTPRPPRLKTCPWIIVMRPSLPSRTPHCNGGCSGNQAGPRLHRSDTPLRFLIARELLMWRTPDADSAKFFAVWRIRFRGGLGVVSVPGSVQPSIEAATTEPTRQWRQWLSGRPGGSPLGGTGCCATGAASSSEQIDRRAVAEQPGYPATVIDDRSGADKATRGEVKTFRFSRKSDLAVVRRICSIDRRFVLPRYEFVRVGKHPNGPPSKGHFPPGY